MAAEAGPPHLVWGKFSKAGNAEVRQSARSADDCSLACFRKGTQVWARPGCAALDTDFSFVSDDCGQVIVLYEHPEVASQKANSQVGSIFSAAPEAVPLLLSSFLKDFSSVRINKKYLRWLGGALGEPGARPSDRADGAGIEFETLDHATHSHTFEQLLEIKAARVAEAEPGKSRGAGGDPQGLYQWADSSGSVQISEFAQIPKKFRKSATPITAELMDVGAAAPVHRGEPDPEAFRNICLANQNSRERVADGRPLRDLPPDFALQEQGVDQALLTSQIL